MLVTYKPYNYNLNVYSSSWFPFWGQGWFVGFNTAFVKYVYYTVNGKKTKVICKKETEDVIKHEYSHFVLYKTRYNGIFKWIKYVWAYLSWWGIMLAFPHSVFPFEIEVNKIKEKLNRGDV